MEVSLKPQWNFPKTRWLFRQHFRPKSYHVWWKISWNSLKTTCWHLCRLFCWHSGWLYAFPPVANPCIECMHKISGGSIPIGFAHFPAAILCTDCLQKIPGRLNAIPAGFLSFPPGNLCTECLQKISSQYNLLPAGLGPFPVQIHAQAVCKTYPVDIMHYPWSCTFSGGNLCSVCKWYLVD